MTIERAQESGERLYEPRQLYQTGEMPPFGEIPKYMHAWVVTPETIGQQPENAFKPDIIESPRKGDLKPNEAIIMVMAAGLNPNANWGALGKPLDVVKLQENRKSNQHPGKYVGGSDASGVVWAVGNKVENVSVGDNVVVHCGMWDEDAKEIKEGLDPMFHPSFGIWGYERPGGSFAQFAKIQAHQLLPKPKEWTFEEAAVVMLDGTTAYRMLRGWPGHVVEKGDAVLIWGGAGGLGAMAIQIVNKYGGIPIAVVSSKDKAKFCLDLGAKGIIDRTQFDHWGLMPDMDTEKYNEWQEKAIKFKQSIRDISGKRLTPRIVFEHPGEDTFATSLFVCENGGMVVTCAATSGYRFNGDFRPLWMRQKRVQGSHFGNDSDARGFHNHVMEGDIDPCLPDGNIYDFGQLPMAHQKLLDGKQLPGKMAVLVNAPKRGLKDIKL